MAACNLETTIIDNLVICFLAAPALLAELREIDGLHIGNFFLSRSKGRFHRHYFHVSGIGIGKLGNLCFDLYTNDEEQRYVWLKVENHVLYSPTLVEEIKRLPTLLGLTFNGITSLDLARDFGYNITSRIRAMMRRDELAVIINGKEVKDRTAMLKGVYRTCGMSLAKDGTKGLTIKQAKSVKNKYLGITLDSYDKAEEIESASGKRYISEFYGYRKRIHRLEMRMNCEQIKRAVRKLGLSYDLCLLEDRESLNAIYIYALQSVLRFRRGRKVLQWEDLFKCGVK